MTAVAVAVGLTLAGFSAARWLRVAQREHYLPGACWSSARRWIICRPPNLYLALAQVAAITFSLYATLRDVESASILTGLVTSLLALLFPWGMPILGSPKLKLTRRARTLALVVAALYSAVSISVSLLIGIVPSVAVSLVLMPSLVDLALLITSPFEIFALEKHRQRAEKKLNGIAPLVIGVTGSWGKTSTKNHIHDLLTGEFDVVASPASWNNTAGLSRTMNDYLGDGTEVLVAEMGMYGPGEIRSLCSWVRPSIGVICSIGPMHLERVGSMEGIVNAKAELLEGVRIAVLWVDDPRIRELGDRIPVDRILRVGTKGTQSSVHLDVEVEVDQASGDVSIWSSGAFLGVCPQSAGVHPGNIGCAVAASLAAGASEQQVARRLLSISNPPHRASIGTNDSGVMIIDDTYNSNPVGAKAALELLERSATGERVVVTPGMVELGSIQFEENKRFAGAVSASGAKLVVVGWTNRRSLMEGATGSVVAVADRKSATQWIRQNLRANDGVLWENDLPDHYP